MAKLNKRQQEIIDRMPADQKEKLLAGLSNQDHTPEPKQHLDRASDPGMMQENPFNVLGLLAGSTEKEISKRKAQINAYLNVGKHLAFEEDIPSMAGAVDRSAESIAEAFTAIDQYRTRAVHGFFWFVDGSRADGPALSHLRAGDTEKARDIWYRVTSVGDLSEQNLTCASNLGTLTFQTGWGNMETLAVGLNWKIKVLDSPLLPRLLERLGDASVAREPGDFVALWSSHFANLILPVYASQPSAMKKLAASMDGARAVTAALLKQPIEEYYAKEVERQVENTIRLRKKNKPSAHLAGHRLVGSAKLMAAAYSEFSGSSSMVYQHSADQLAEELLECSVAHWNAHHDDDSIDTKTVSMLMEFARELATGKMLVARIKDNWVTMQEYIDGAQERTHLASVAPQLEELRLIINRFDPERAGLEEVEMFIGRSQTVLGKIKLSLGESNELYVSCSSAVVTKAQGALVHIVNSAQKSEGRTQLDKVDASLTLKKALELQDKLGHMAMSSELKERYLSNLTILQDINRALLSSALSTFGITSPPTLATQTGRSISIQTSGSSSPRPNTSSSSEGYLISWVERNMVAISVFVLITLLLVVCNN